MSLLGKLLNRRVFQISGIYLGVIFAAFEFTDMVVDRYGLSDQLVDVVLAGMLSFLPGVIMLAWFHGAPGKDQWSRIEKVGLPVNAIVSAILILTLLPGAPADALSETRTALDENGVEITLEVARADLTKRVAVFFLNPQGFTQTEPWEAYASGLMLARSLDRDPVISAYTLYENSSQGFVWQVKRAGHDTALNVPVSLLQSIADQYHQDYFTTGTITLNSEGYIATVDLYQTSPLQKIGSFRVAANDIYALVDQTAGEIKDQLSEGRMSGPGLEYFPVEDLLTDNTQAIEAYIRGRNERLLRNDVDRSVEFLKQAVAIDPDFTLAYRSLAETYSSQGDFATALVFLKELNRVSYRLSEVEKIRTRAWGYWLRSETDKAIKVYEMWTELDPDNYQAWSDLAIQSFWSGDRMAQSTAAFEKSLELLPNQDWLLDRLADLYLAQHRVEDAIVTLLKYHDMRPGDYTPLVKLGDIESQRGNLDVAADYYRRGNHAQTQMVTPILRLALNQAKQGRLDESFSYLDDAEFVAQAPRQHATLLATRSRIRLLMGQPKAALDRMKKQLEAASQVQTRLDTVMTHLRGIWLYVQADEIEDAEIFLESIADMFPPPFDFVPDIGWMVLRLSEEDYDQASVHNRRIEQAIRATGREDLLYLTVFTDGVILRNQGDVESGLEQLSRAVALYGKSIQQTQEDGQYDHERILLELARTQVASGKPADALETLTAVLTPWPHHPEGNWLAAQAYHQQGNSTAVRAALDRALDMWDRAEANYDLARQAKAFEASL